MWTARQGRGKPPSSPRLLKLFLWPVSLPGIFLCSLSPCALCVLSRVLSLVLPPRVMPHFLSLPRPRSAHSHMCTPAGPGIQSWGGCNTTGASHRGSGKRVKKHDQLTDSTERQLWYLDNKFFLVYLLLSLQSERCCNGVYSACWEKQRSKNRPVFAKDF